MGFCFKNKGYVYQKEQSLFYTASNVYQASNKLKEKLMVVNEMNHLSIEKTFMFKVKYTDCVTENM